MENFGNFVAKLRTFWCTYTDLNNMMMYQNRSISGMVLVLLICCLQEKVSFDTNTYMLPFNIHLKSKPHSKCDRGRHSQFCRRKGNTSFKCYRLQDGTLRLTDCF